MFTFNNIKHPLIKFIKSNELKPTQTHKDIYYCSSLRGHWFCTYRVSDGTIAIAPCTEYEGLEALALGEWRNIRVSSVLGETTMDILEAIYERLREMQVEL